MIDTHRPELSTVRITALKPQAHHPDRVNVYVDGEFRCGLALEIAYGGGLRVGDEVAEATLAALEREDLLWKAREAALNLLSYRARSEAELRQRLRRKDYPDDIVEACVAELVEKGFVDDAAFAASFVRDRVRGKPRGARRLVQELRAKGVAPETAAAAVDGTLEAEEVTELGMAREVAAGWARRSLGRQTARRAGGDPAEDRLAARRRLYGYLARRGFSGEVIRTVMEEVLPHRGD
ncbi:MAG TPA: regulatory protein RecX [Longimicrobiales bacterium]